MFSAPADWYLASRARARPHLPPRRPATCSAVFGRGVARVVARVARRDLGGGRAAHPDARRPRRRHRRRGHHRVPVRRRAPGQPHARHVPRRARAGRSGLHGAQVGVASVVAAAAWEHLFAVFDPAEAGARCALPRHPTTRARHRARRLRRPRPDRARRRGVLARLPRQADPLGAAPAHRRGRAGRLGPATAPSWTSCWSTPAHARRRAGGRGRGGPVRRPGPGRRRRDRRAGPSRTATSCATGSPSSTCSTCSGGGPTRTTTPCWPRPDAPCACRSERRGAMTGDLVIGIDCSTTATKAVVWDRDGRAVAEGRRDLRAQLAAAGLGRAEPRGLVDAPRAPRSGAPRRASTRAGSPRSAITHQRETFACVTEDGHPLRPAMLWLDTPGHRGGRRVRHRRRCTGSPASRRTRPRPGTSCCGCAATSRRRWSAPSGSSTCRPTSCTGSPATGAPAGPARTRWACVDMRTFDYDHELLDRRRACAASRCRSCTRPARCSARSRPTLADDWTCRAALPVVAGVGDGQSAGLGTGSSSPGSAYLNLGTGLVSGSYSETYATGMEFRVLSGAVPRTYVFETLIGGGTYNVSWFVEKFSGVDPRAARAGPVRRADPGDRRGAAAAGCRGPARAAVLGGRADPVLGHQRPRARSSG